MGFGQLNGFKDPLEQPELNFVEMVCTNSASKSAYALVESKSRKVSTHSESPIVRSPLFTMHLQLLDANVGNPNNNM